MVKKQTKAVPLIFQSKNLTRQIKTPFVDKLINERCFSMGYGDKSFYPV